MILILDIGNTSITIAGFKDNKKILQLKKLTDNFSTNEFASFIKNHLNNHNIDIVLASSVVPYLDKNIKRTFKEYFDKEVIFLDYKIYKKEIENIIDINTDFPSSTGADLIAGAIGAIKITDQVDKLIVVDMGTCTTFMLIEDILSKAKFTGGNISLGIASSIKSFGLFTAKLPYINFDKIDFFYGKNTIDSLKAGLYYSQLGSLKENIKIIKNTFDCNNYKVIATGGYADIFKEHGIFDIIDEDLIYKGLLYFYETNFKLDIKEI